MRAFSFQLGIRGKLLLAFLAIIVPSIPLISALIFGRGMRVDEDRQRTVLEGMRDTAAVSLDSYLDLVRRTPYLIAQTAYLDEYVHGRQLLEIGGIDPSEPGVDPLGYAFPPLTEESLETRRQLITTSFLSIMDNEPGVYRSIIFVGPDGREWVKVEAAGPTGDSNLLDHSNAPFFRQCMDAAAGQPLYQEIIPAGTEAESYGDARLRLAMPVLQRGAVGVDSEALAAAMAFTGQKPLGVIVVDCRLSKLAEILKNVRVGETGTAFAWDRESGRFVVPPRIVIEGSPVSADTAFESLRTFLSAGRPTTRNVGIVGTPYLLSFSPTKHNPFTVGAIVSVREMSAVLEEMRYSVIMISIVMFCVFLVLALILVRRLAAPIRDFASAADQLAAGDFAARVPVRSRDEVGRLAVSFNSMAGRLGEYVRELEVKHRIEHELALAHRIQLGLLPRVMPEMAGLEVMGRTLPAREVGGDYFDFFRPNGDSLGVAVGDVCGKGVPAALLMSGIRSALRAQVAGGDSPEAVLSALNQYLLPDVYESGNFVALLYAVYFREDRRLIFSNAGQVFPLVYHRATGVCEYVECVGLPLGAMASVAYRHACCRLDPGDIILFHTDGCVESMNAQKDFFGFDRLRDSLVRYADQSAEGIVNAVLKDIQDFAINQDQYDDITLAVLKVQ